MEHQIIKGFLLGTMIFLSSCYYDNEETLYPSTECITADMSYQNDIVPIISSNCYVCHSAIANTGNITLEGYTEIKKYVDSGQLMGAINHASGFKPMPEDAPKLNDCLISKIDSWIAAGAPNN
jgi:hypothetical protein